MKELIEINKLKKWRADRIQSGDCSYNDMTALEAFIETVERVDRPQGEWIFHSEWEEYWCRYECSLCGRTFDHEMNYCGFCGARMKGADDE